MIKEIFKSGLFMYNGKVYKLDISETKKDPSNHVSASTPINKLVGVNANGEVVRAIASRCSVAEVRTGDPNPGPTEDPNPDQVVTDPVTPVEPEPEQPGINAEVSFETDDTESDPPVIVAFESEPVKPKKSKKLPS